ncbi:MAG: YesL family protein [Chloroflexi bacterium]|nr:YesL family protein [Chloroflexota bacterium]MCC6891644.1 YesL family protein [Anaerolineae bacterium]
MIDQKLRDGLIDAYVALIPMIILNVLWFIVSLPLVTAFPATGGLFYATNRLAHGKSANWRTFFEGFRIHFWRSWAVGLVNLFLALVFAVNFIFYSWNNEQWVLFARGVVIVVALVWLALQVYLFPLLMEQEEPRLRLALRNSSVIMLKRPLLTLGATLLIALVGILSTFVIQPAWIFITASSCAFLANRATLYAIAQITGKKTDSPQPE